MTIVEYFERQKSIAINSRDANVCPSPSSPPHI